MEKCIIFGDSKSYITNILLDHFIKINNKLKYFEIIAIIDTQRETFRKSLFKTIALHTIKFLFNKEFRSFEFVRSFKYLKTDLYIIGKKYSIPTYSFNINSLEFHKFLDEKQPKIGVVIGCPQIFKSTTIKKFDYLVNYHNSLLPKYRGLNATAWSIYYGENITGFTFHIVNESIDTGNIIIQDFIEINKDKSSFELEIIKTKKAAERLEDLFNKIKYRDKGKPQEGDGSYFGKKDLEKIITIENPKAYNFDELYKRLKAFGVLNIKIGDKFYPVTHFIYNKNEKKGFGFEVKDGFVKIERILYMPVFVYKIYNLLKSYGGKK